MVALQRVVHETELGAFAGGTERTLEGAYQFLGTKREKVRQQLYGHVSGRGRGETST
jgi:hypothetical protein